MNSAVSNTDSLQEDDTAGAHILYDPGRAFPAIVLQPAGTIVAALNPVTLAVAATGTGPFTYSWGFRATGTTVTQRLGYMTDASYTFGSIQTGDAGTYTCSVTNLYGTANSTSATLAVTSVATDSATLLANISTRGVVGTGGDILIAGLTIGGTSAITVLVRAAGPALAALGVTGTLADPELKILNNAGATVAQNDNWETPAPGGATSAQISAAFARLGGFAFPAGSRDAAVLVTLPPGGYSAQISGVGGTTGVALVEAYDADPDLATSRTRKLTNIATRGQVGLGGDILIAGLVVTGPGPRTYLIRAIGPTLATFGVAGALLDPYLKIYQGTTLLRENDDWDNPQSLQPAILAAAKSVGAFALRDVRGTNPTTGLDSVLLMTLKPGAYTVQVSGFREATGVALVEIYELP